MLVESQAIGNGQGITPAWQTNAQAIGGRERFDVKFNRGIDHTWLLVGKGLQFRIVRGGHGCHMPFQQEGENGPGQR